MIAQNLSHQVCGVIIRCEQCALCARSTHGVHHAMLGELHVVVRVHILVVVCDDAVVRRTLVLIAVAVGFVFVVAIFHRILLYWRYIVYKSCAWSCGALSRLFRGVLRKSISSLS